MNEYRNFIADLDVETITCPNCGTLDMERYGYYKRYRNISTAKYYIRILRVRCKTCGRTHAVLSDFIVSSQHIAYVKKNACINNKFQELKKLIL